MYLAESGDEKTSDSRFVRFFVIRKITLFPPLRKLFFFTTPIHYVWIPYATMTFVW